MRINFQTPCRVQQGHRKFLAAAGYIKLRCFVQLTVHIARCLVCLVLGCARRFSREAGGLATGVAVLESGLSASREELRIPRQERWAPGQISTTGFFLGAFVNIVNIYLVVTPSVFVLE